MSKSKTVKKPVKKAAKKKAPSKPPSKPASKATSKAATKGLPAHLQGIHKKKRIVQCEVCGVDVEIAGPATKKLCPKHRAEYYQQKRRAKYERERTAEDVPEALRSVQGGLRPETGAAPEPVPDPLPRPPEEKGSEEKAEVAGKVETKRASFAEAIELISRAEQKGEGFRHGWLGNTGSGKTTSLRTFLEHGKDKLTLIHDDTKRDAQYAGSVVERFSDADPNAHHVVFRGNVFAGTVVEPEAVALLGLEICKKARSPCRVVIDELDRAVTPGGQELSSMAIRTCLTQGRALGLSFTWTTQAPQRAPKEVIDQSDTIAIGKIGPRALNYLRERLFLDPALVRVIPYLKQGEFVIYEQAQNWNGLIYVTPPPGAMNHAENDTSGSGADRHESKPAEGQAGTVQDQGTTDGVQHPVGHADQGSAGKLA